MPLWRKASQPRDEASRFALTRLVFLLALFITSGSIAAGPAPYPADVKAAFVRSCATVHEEMLPPCRCMIRQFERRMPLEEFIAFSRMQDPTRDRRFTTVANGCIDRLRRSNR